LDAETVRLLNQLNQDFYARVADSFDATRLNPWAGWSDLLPYIKQLKARPALRVLDLGCGNGRFGVFLGEHVAIDYTGIDSNAYLLGQAAKHLPDTTLINADLLSDALPVTPPYDLIAVFGVIHHLPGFSTRRDFIMKAAGWLAEGGLLAMTFWKFYENETLRARIVPWDANLSVEKNDFLLDWRRDTDEPALRYCHYVDDDEAGKLLDGLHITARYDADHSNQYVLLTNPGYVRPPQ
jgi:SAM-dependent methyltransferase